MSRSFFDTTNKDVDSEAETARRRSFIARMERKLDYKSSLLEDQDASLAR